MLDKLLQNYTKRWGGRGGGGNWVKDNNNGRVYSMVPPQTPFAHFLSISFGICYNYCSSLDMQSLLSEKIPEQTSVKLTKHVWVRRYG